MAVATPLGEDVLLLKSLSGTEQLGRLFQYELELQSEDFEIKFDDIVGQNVTVRLNLPNNKVRYFNGMVSRFAQVQSPGRLAVYRAVMAPWLWFLTRTADCRIFQQMTAPEIILKMFRDLGFKDFKDSLTHQYRKWDYCVQYRETDFNFASRLMEQEGIYYYFEHENGKHMLVLADSKSAHAAYGGYEELVYRTQEQGGVDQEFLYDWTVGKEVQPGQYALNDYDFEKPNTKLLAKANLTRGHAAAEFEIYDYPGEYGEFGDGETYARRRIEELHAQHEVVEARGRARGVCTGRLFTLTGHPRADQNREYLITAVTHHASSDDYDTAGAGGGGAGEYYECQMRALSTGETYRSARLTAKPSIQGPQTAVVVGPAGEEIYTDKYGRVKVKFHWDRDSKADENSSCWIRVAQTWAGKKWGSVYTPRVGQEVVVDFLEGDPDRPLITGRVYNAVNMPPYDLPANKTMSTVKSNSSKGGQGFNEIRFEDKKGEEQIFIHGEKNVDIRVKNDTFEWIGNKQHLIVKKDQFEHVENNRSEIVDADHMEKIGKDRHLKVAGKEAKAVDGTQSLTVKDDVIEVFKANHSEQTTKDYYLKADNIVIEGMTNVTLKVGGSSIAIEASGIGIKTSGQIKIEAGATMDLKASAPLKIESSATADLKSTTTSVKGDATVIVQGGMVKIN